VPIPPAPEPSQTSDPQEPQNPELTISELKSKLQEQQEQIKEDHQLLVELLNQKVNEGEQDNQTFHQQNQRISRL
jgi:hypothetical protein